MIPETVAATESPTYLSLSQDADIKMGCSDTEMEDKFMSIGHFEKYEHKISSLSLKVKKKEQKQKIFQTKIKWNADEMMKGS